MRIKHLAVSLLTIILLAGIGCKQHEPQQTDDGNMLLGNPSNASHNPVNADN